MKRVILRVMMLVAMASAAVTMSVHTSSKEVKASEKGDAVVKYAKNFVGNRYRYGGSSLKRNRLFRIHERSLQEVWKTSSTFLKCTEKIW